MKKSVVVSIILLICLAVLATPLLFPYHPPLEATEAYETDHVTDTTYFGNLTKNIQSFIEDESCVYTILGWDEDENLYYRTVCEGISETFMYVPSTKANSMSQQLPEQLAKDAYPDDQLLEMVRATGVRPERHEPYTRPLLLMDETATISPTGSYIAFITKQIYSVQDIVLITQ
ncbi:MAG: hypothetical protein GY943_39230 [Chloroflexi bacterium]|nr:hypothetical protein [Chloroflexota bacterium]